MAWLPKSNPNGFFVYPPWILELVPYSKLRNKISNGHTQKPRTITGNFSNACRCVKDAEMMERSERGVGWQNL